MANGQQSSIISPNGIRETVVRILIGVDNIMCLCHLGYLYSSRQIAHNRQMGAVKEKQI